MVGLRRGRHHIAMLYSYGATGEGIVSDAVCCWAPWKSRCICHGRPCHITLCRALRERRGMFFPREGEGKGKGLLLNEWRLLSAVVTRRKERAVFESREWRNVEPTPLRGHEVYGGSSMHPNNMLYSGRGSPCG